ncbi:MAG: hypothetical protein FJW34_00015 [Acidobacteria bacterium]|nr:hypothetical protein [Acidobacteriota bacterium]
MPLERVKEFKDTTFKYDAPAGWALEIKRYMTGTGLTVWQTINFPASSGVRTYTAPLDGLEAILIKLKAMSTGVVRLHGGVIRFRAIGVYFDGANGEIWETQELGFGI